MDPLEQGGLAVAVAPWPDDARSPVSLMLDDLTDGWIDRDRSGLARGGNDWGHGLDEPGSAFHWLRTGLLDPFPEAHATFFVPVDRVEDVRPARHPGHYLPIDRRPEFGRWLRALDADPRFECAYHGRDHGVPGPTDADYVPEFAREPTLEAALRTIEAGKEIWRRVFGQDPMGGKFPAYAWGRHGEQAVDQSGFFWWCRRWDRDLAGRGDPVARATRFFGETPVVDVPSTLHGGFLAEPPLRSLPLRKIPGALRYRTRLRPLLDAEISELLAARAPITIQEHINQSRSDERNQTPNVFDDLQSLRWIYTRLRREHVWHATCSQIAEYFEAHSRAHVSALSGDRFTFSYTDGRDRSVALSLCLSGAPLPDRFALRGDKEEHIARVSRRSGPFGCVTAPVRLSPGQYRIAPLPS